VSWQLGAFSLLAIALVAGFAWYERSRPDTRIVALVATLAAFAALGRIAFAAIPNVKPTTDIVLISGYALGGGPGFVVGAVAGLTSNFFFGQGPWTPWQMAAWGATGLIGAVLARPTKGTIGRWPLALVCGVVGFAFTAVQDVGDWVTYSDHSLAQLGVYVGKGVGFDAVHAVGCVAFALAFGPALIRSIARFAARINVTWRVPGGAVVPVLIAAAVLLAPVSSARAATPAGYLLGAQNGDGGFGAAPGAPSSQLYSGWAALGLAAEGYNLQTVQHGGPNALGYIGAGVRSLTDPGSLERTILVVRAAGRSATSFAGENLLAALQSDVRGDGSVSDQVNLTSFAVLALKAAGVSPPGAMLSWLAGQQDSDGGFNFATAGATSDVDDSGAALEALAGSASSAQIARAVRFITAEQNSDGGFPSQPGATSNAQSTAWAIQGLVAVGAGAGAIQRAEGYLRSLIAPDGHVRYSGSSDQTPVWVTAQAVMALAGKPLPFAAPDAARAATTQTASHRTQRTEVKSALQTPIRRRVRSLRVKRAPPPPSLDGYAADVGALMALALAPVQ
jgi:energy-coupling factor transport system substrate-specific component